MLERQKLVYGYCRASTGNQKDSIPNQRIAVEQAVVGMFQPRGYTFGGWYEDEAVSGAKKFQTRRNGGRLYQVVEKGDLILMSKLDRGFRSLTDLLETYHALAERGVYFRAMDFDFDGSTPVGKLVMQIMASVAEFERERIAERMREGLIRAKERGPVNVGSPPFGYMNAYHASPTGGKQKVHRVRCEPELTVARRIAHMRDIECLTFSAISRILISQGVRRKNGGRFTPPKVHKTLQDYRKFLEKEQERKDLDNERAADYIRCHEPELLNGRELYGRQLGGKDEDGPRSGN